jgi:hypothetical protein
VSINTDQFANLLNIWKKVMNASGSADSQREQLERRQKIPGYCTRMPAYKDLSFKADYRQIQEGGEARDKKAGQSP